MEIYRKNFRFYLCKLLRLKINKTQWELLMQFVKFGIVGLSNTVISYVIYVVTLILFQKNNLIPSVDYLAAQVIAFVLSVLWSFYWNNKFVFEKADNEERNIVHAFDKDLYIICFYRIVPEQYFVIIMGRSFGYSKNNCSDYNLLVSVPLNFIYE